MPASNRRNRPDRNGAFRTQFETNRKIILATQSVCAICGKPVDFSLKSPDPMSATVDHIIPIAKHGHPSALENLQLAHRICNRLKSDRLENTVPAHDDKNGGPVNKFPTCRDWRTQ